MNSRLLPRTPRLAASSDRFGSALVLVLVVIVLLSLGAYTYSEVMLTEYRASDAYTRQVQSRASALSAVEFVAALLTADGGGFDDDLFDNPGLFHIGLTEDSGFTIVAPREGAESGLLTEGVLRMGLIDESARLNINVLADTNLFPADDTTPRQMLLALPGMTEDLADAILDWIDSDDEVRPYGAEATNYTIAVPRNGPIDTLEELLLVEGVTLELLYGEDANRNGVLDPNENDGEESLPWDNADGILEQGWSQYLTVTSKEQNIRHNAGYFGEERLNLNEPLLAELWDTLEEAYGEDVATFVTAFRLRGPLSDDSETYFEAYSDWNPLIGASSSAYTTGDFETDQALQETASNLAKNLFSGEGSVTRGGLDLTAGASYDINSIYDLIGARVEVEIAGQPVTLESPWSSDPGTLQEILPDLLDAFTLSTNETIMGRINVNQATREVLLALPDMPSDLPDKIIAARSNRSSQGAVDDFATSGWLLIQGLVDLPTMRVLDRFLTTRGDVYRLQAIGHADRPGPLSRVEAVIDASEIVPRVLQLRDLGELGPGFRRDQLPGFAVP